MTGTREIAFARKRLKVRANHVTQAAGPMHSILRPPVASRVVFGMFLICNNPGQGESRSCTRMQIMQSNSRIKIGGFTHETAEWPQLSLCFFGPHGRVVVWTSVRNRSSLASCRGDFSPQPKITSEL